MEQLSKIGFWAAHRKYRDIEMFKELCAYQDTDLTPHEANRLKKAIRSVAIENFELYKKLEKVTGEPLPKKLTVDYIVQYHMGRPECEYEEVERELQKVENNAEYINIVLLFTQKDFEIAH